MNWYYSIERKNQDNYEWNIIFINKNGKCNINTSLNIIPRVGLFRRHFVAAAITGICRLRERGLERGTQDGSRLRAATKAAGPASSIFWISSVGLPGLAAWARRPERARFWASSSRMRLCSAPISSLKPWKKLHRYQYIGLGRRHYIRRLWNFNELFF